MKVSTEKHTAEDLIGYKLRNIRALIVNILNRWNEDSAETFLRKAKEGIYSEAENDAVDLKQLLLEEEKLIDLLEHLEEE